MEPTMEPIYESTPSTTYEPIASFDGVHYTYTNDVFSMSNDTISIANHTEFINCTFINNTDTIISVTRHVNVSFMNCFFVDNILTTIQALYAHSILSFDGCIFANNIQMGRPLLNIHSGSITLHNTDFMQLSSDKHTSMILITPYFPIHLAITGCIFSDLYDFNALIEINERENTTLAIPSNITLHECIWMRIDAIIIYHRFIHTPITRMNIVSSSMNMQTIYYPFLQTTSHHNQPCSYLPSHYTHSFHNISFVDTVLHNVLLPQAPPLFTFQCANILFESSTFNSNTASNNVLCRDPHPTLSYNVLNGACTKTDICTVHCALGGNTVWFGSADGQTPHPEYDFESFILTAKLQIHETTTSSTNAGIVLRAQSSALYYYVTLFPNSNFFVFRGFGPALGSKGWANLAKVNYDFKVNVTYDLRIEVIGGSYAIYLNNNLKFTLEATHYMSGSIGLKTFGASVSFYSLAIEPIHTSNHTQNETIYGGLMEVSGANHLHITHSVFEHNLFYGCGLIYDHATVHNALMLYPRTSIEHSVFHHNSAQNGAVICDLYGSSYAITDCNFTNNIATESGGVIYANIPHYMNQSIHIIGSHLRHNTANKHGGIIYANEMDVHLESCDIHHNKAGIVGGAVVIMSEHCDTQSNQLIISESTSIRSHTAQIGGAIASACSQIRIGNVIQIVDNVASIGGAIYAHHSCVSSFAQDGFIISNNTAAYGGALAFTGGVSDGNYCVSQLQHVDLSHNEASMQGGAIHVAFASHASLVNDTTVHGFNVSLLPAQLSFYNASWETASITSFIISDANITHTLSTTYGSGITVECEDTHHAIPISITIKNTTFNRNELHQGNGSEYNGGSAITYLAHHQAFSELIISDCVFEGSTVQSNVNGGLIWIDLHACYGTTHCACYTQYNETINSHFYVQNTRFSHSSAIHGGAIYATLPVTAVDSTFTKTEAQTGGCIYSACSSISCISCRFTTNSAYGMDGGMVYVDNSAVFVSNSVFANNTATLGSAAIAIRNITELISRTMDFNYDDLILVDQCRFIDNIGRDYGALYIANDVPSIPTARIQILHSDNTWYNETKHDNLVLFAYSDRSASAVSMTVQFSSLLDSNDTDANTIVNQCELQHNTHIVPTFIAIDTVFVDIDGLCIAFDDSSHRRLVHWNQLNSSNVDLHWIASDIDSSITGGCTTQSMTPIIHKSIARGTYCFAAWYHDTEYHIIIKQIYEWTPSFITINNSVFTNNTAAVGQGGAITITTNAALSISITNSIFNYNYASLGGGAIYAQLSATDYDQMRVIEMQNITMIHNTAYMQGGGCILVEIQPSEWNGFIFKNAVFIQNMKARHNKVIESSANGGSIHLFGANLYITDSHVSAGSSFDGGCLFATYSALTLHNTTMAECTAYNEGGAFKNALLQTHSASNMYELCLSLYYTDFVDNQAAHHGSDLYLELRGRDISHSQRQTCVKTFEVNHGVDTTSTDEKIYLSVDAGDHDLLYGVKPVSGLCEYTECTSNVLQYFCVSRIAAECTDKQNISNDAPNITISGTPGSLFVLYVFGWNIYHDALKTFNFSIHAESDLSTIANPNGISDESNDFYAIPFVIDIAQDNQTGSLIISDTNGIAQAVYVNLAIQDCANGYYKRRNVFDERYFSCELCGVSTYTMANEECKMCGEGLTCTGKNDVIVNENWYARSHHDNADELETALCAPKYCCTQSNGCHFDDKQSLCAPNRNPDVLMCGECNEGFSETLSISGKCNNCNDSQGIWIAVVWMIFGFVCVSTLYYFDSKERTVPHPLITYVSRTLLFFYQTLGFIVFRTSVPTLTILSELATLNFDFVPNGTCLVRNVTARGKLYMTLIIPLILVVDVLLLYLVLRVLHWKAKIENWKNQMIAFQNVFSVIYSIIYVQVLFAFTRLFICYPMHDGVWYMWYAGGIQCYDAGHIIAAIIAFVLIILPLISLGWLRYYKFNKPDIYETLCAGIILEYNEQCWYYSSFDLFRRGLLIAVPLFAFVKELSFRTYLIAMECVVILIIHCVLTPYRWRINNHLETFAIFMMCCCALISIPDNSEDWISVDSYLFVCGVAPLIPIPFLFYEYSFEWCRTRLHRLKISDRPALDNPNDSLRMLSVVSDLSLLSPKAQANNQTSQTGVTFTATPTKSGWKYPFKSMQWWTKSSKNQSNEHTIFIEGTIHFSHSIPSNTIIDMADITQHLNYHTKHIGSQTDVKAVFGGGTLFHLNFECNWRNVDRLSDELKKISPKLAMETAVIETLTDNDPFLNDIMKSFKVKDQNIKITEFKLNGSFSDVDINNILVEEIAKQRAKDAKALKTRINSELTTKPLHEFTKENVADTVRSWVLNDVEYISRTKLLMRCLCEQRLSGKRLVKLENNLKMVLEKHLIVLIHEASFNDVFAFLENTIDDDPDTISTKSAPEMAQILSDFELNSFCTYIDRNDINGEEVTRYAQSNDTSWIKNCTKWNDDQINQIITVLLQHKTETSDEIEQLLMDQINRELGEDMAGHFCKNIEHLDLSRLQLKLRNGLRIGAEAEAIMNIVEEIQSVDDLAQSDDSVHNIYLCIAKCLQMDDDWVCFNCGNHNFYCVISGQLNRDIGLCSVCGLDQQFSIIYALTHVDTYYMTMCLSDTESLQTRNDSNDTNALDNKIHTSQIDISCPNAMNKTDCVSMKRLCEKIIFYQEWLHKIKHENGKNDIESTTAVDLLALSDKLFDEIVIRSAQQLKQKITDDQMQTIKHLLQEKSLNIHMFCDLSRREFIKNIRKSTRIKPGVCSTFYKTISKDATTQAQKIGFGALFDEIESSELDADYHHIIHTHVHNGSKYDKENVFRYFQSMVSCDEANCGSLSRSKQRENTMMSDRKPSASNISNAQLNERTLNVLSNKEYYVQSKDQYYVQSTLDMIHKFLVHYDWKNDISTYNDDDDDDPDEFSAKYTVRSTQRSTQRSNYNPRSTQRSGDLKSATGEMMKHKSKYITDSTMICQSYGFGVDHDYIHLFPVFKCMRDEILNHKLAALSVTLFEHLLIKSLKMRSVAHNEYDLQCTHYDAEYNIIRNKPIGVRHLLAIVIYTDCSAFCTVFRSTFRMVHANESEESVTKRHCQLYFYSRFIYEALEYFGNEMPKRLGVYHGLNCVMFFNRFTAWFNQPISTTNSLAAAYQFADSTGIILKFKRVQGSNSSMIPKYLNVSWLSAYPNEDEKLFYGKHVVFEIYDIIEAATCETHRKDLKLLNLFQKLVKNKHISWDQNNHDMIPNMVQLIHKQRYGMRMPVNHSTEHVAQQKHGAKLVPALEGVNSYEYKKIDNADSQESDEEEEKRAAKESDYGAKLFDFFCCHSSTKWICIRDFEGLPSLLKNALMKEMKNDDEVSFVGLTTIFPFCNTIVLNDLKSKRLTERSKKYIECSIKYIKCVANDEKMNDNLNEIIFESQEEMESKSNSTLHKIAKKYHKAFNKYNWTIQYEFTLDIKHTLAFRKKTKMG
eukprot:561167_1